MDSSYEALTQRAGFAELAGRTLIEVAGPDRASLLHSFTTGDIKRLTPGTGCEAFVTSPQGKTLGHVFVFCETDRLLLDTSPAQAAVLIAHFERYVITEEVAFVDRTADRCVILLAGPQAAVILEKMTGATPPAELLDHVPATVGGQAVCVRRTPYAGSHSYFVESAADAAMAVQEALAAAGAVAAHPAAVEAVRLEAGFPLFGQDITGDNLPQEVARDRQAISFTKGCYLGQETVARIDALGHVNRLLRGVRFAGTKIPPAGALLLAAEQPVGHVTFAAWSPLANAPLGMAYIRRQHSKAGSFLAWEGGPAEVVELPLAGRA